jgi:hypothetical protein
MNNNPFIYIRVLRNVEQTVFAVSDGQKNYWNNQFGCSVAFSSGQQVKRSVLTSLTESLGVTFAPITFNWEIKKGESKKGGDKAEQKEPHSPCDPSFVDQMIGGYMKAETGTYTVKRRSPMSISAMRPLHPLLANVTKENLTFDRTSHPDLHKVVVKSGDKVMSQEELNEWLTTNQRNLPSRAFIQDQKRTSGLFVNDIALDLRTLFCVSSNKIEPELFPAIEEKLKAQGWVSGENVFGKCLICPKDKRDAIIPALAKALIVWRITSNQSRNYSPMELLAIAIGNDANQTSFAISAHLMDETESGKDKAVPVLNEQTTSQLFITPSCKGIIKGQVGDVKAIDAAVVALQKMIEAFPYETQLTTT